MKLTEIDKQLIRLQNKYEKINSKVNDQNVKWKQPDTARPLIISVLLLGEDK